VQSVDFGCLPFTPKNRESVGKSNGASSPVWNVPERVGGHLRQSTFLALFGFPSKTKQNDRD